VDFFQVRGFLSATQSARPAAPKHRYPAQIIPLKGAGMIGDLFDSPWKILIVVVVLVVLFGSAKLPAAARSLGKSMRILKTEVKSLHEDDAEPGFATPAPAGTQELLTAQQQLAAQQAQRQIDDLQRQLADLQGPAEAQPAAQRVRQPG
jgi:sec-independent protein translocase protein TatA